MNIRVSLVISLAVAFPLAALAADPAIKLQQSEVIAFDGTIKSFRVPTVNANGKISYWDVTVDLQVDGAGRIANTATVATAKSAPIQGDKFVPGPYASGSADCTVTISILNGGRQEGALYCYNGRELRASWTTGAIAGHPFELDLRAAGIDQIPGHENYAWGKVGYTSSNLIWWECFNTNDVISVRQVGTQLTLTSYDAGNIAQCGAVLRLVQ